MINKLIKSIESDPIDSLLCPREKGLRLYDVVLPGRALVAVHHAANEIFPVMPRSGDRSGDMEIRRVGTLLCPREKGLRLCDVVLPGRALVAVHHAANEIFPVMP